MSYCKPPECDGIPTPSRHVIEPDWIASECDDQLPAFSKIGRGPRGKGVYTEIEKTDDGQIIIHFKDDETGEEIGNTGDIAAGRISVSYAPENPVAGDEVKMFVSVRSGSSVANYVVPVPSGAHGSRIYLLPGPVVRNSDDTYQCSVDDLTIYGLQRWESKPVPRPNDVILFNYEDSDGHGFAFGTIEAVEKGQVVYTARVFNTLPGVSILPDGTWGVDGESTGIKAQGPKGEDAKIKVRREGSKAVITATDSDGETIAEVLDGKDGRDAKLTVQRVENGAELTATDADGVTTATVKDGSNGEDGSDGLPAMLTLGSVQETSQPQVTLVPGRIQENEYIISFGLPRGADGKSIDINGGVYRVDQLPDFDETPVNDAFIVLDDDDRFDLYIRGKEAVIAEEGGPWTVVEDWQGVNGYSMRMLAGRKISTEEVLRISVSEVETAFVPHNGLRDGDLVFDDNGTIGIVGSAMDDSGDYTVSYVDKMNVHWDNIDGKPAFTSTDSIELAEADGQVTANLRLSGEHSNAKFSTVDGKVAAHLDHNVAPAGLGDHSLYFSSDGFKNDSGTIALSDAVTAALGKADSAIQEDDLTAAIAAEASAREKADQLLETEIDSKLDTADLVAGDNITITPDAETGHVTIAAAGGVDVPFSNGTVLIDGSASKLFAQTFNGQVPFLMFAEEPVDDPDDQTQMSKVHTMIGPDSIAAIYTASNDGHKVSSRLMQGTFSVAASTADYSPMGVQAYFGLSQNAEQPMIGRNISSSGFISSTEYLLASTDIYGLAKVDGTTIVSNNGVLSANVQEYGGRSLASVFANEIGSTDIYTWLRNRARNANFAGLRIGDYIDVPITAGANVPSQTVRYRIGAIDHYYQCGDTAKGHHIVMVPLAPVSVTGDKASNTSYLQWRDTNDNNGTAEEKYPYLCSKLHDWEINDFFPALPTALQNAIMAQRVLLEERYSSSEKLTESSGWSWADLGKVWSPSEMEVYGCPVWGTKGYSVGFDSQFPIFSDTASRIAGGRVAWWLRSVVGGSASNACDVSDYGTAGNNAPTIAWMRPLPCFLIG